MTTLAMAGAAIGGSLLTPSVATAPPADAAPEPPRHEPVPAAHDTADAPTLYALPDRDDDRDADRRDTDARPARHKAQPAAHPGGRHRAAEPRVSRATPRHTRPMTSGERQYRNNCRQGLITDHCELVDSKNLLQRGIDPSL